MTIKQHGGVFGRNPSFNDVSVETLSIAGTALSSTASELNILDGVTSDATELNYLDGASTSVVTASKAVLANASANIAFASGNGIDFSATGDAGGRSSELFDDYEEGTWTPTIVDSLGVPFTMTVQNGTYTKTGRMVTVQFFINYSGKGSASSGFFAELRGWPFASLFTGNTTGTNVAVGQPSLEISTTAGRLTLLPSGVASTGVYTLQDGAGPQLVSFYPASGVIRGTMIGYE